LRGISINLTIYFGALISVLSYGQTCNSIVAAYNFNGNSGDITGHGYDLTVYGATLMTDRFGNPLSAYQVNWNQYLEITTSNLPQLYQNFSYSIWYKPDAIHGSIGPIWMYGNNPDSCDAHFALIQTANMMGSSRVIDVWAGCMDSIVLSNIGGGTPGWSQITVVNDGTQIKTYLNGSFYSQSVSFPMLTQSIFTIGSNPGSHTYGCYGLVDDLYIYNCALSDI
jgi:hypothetical protein